MKWRPVAVVVGGLAFVTLVPFPLNVLALGLPVYLWSLWRTRLPSSDEVTTGDPAERAERRRIAQQAKAEAAEAETAACRAAESYLAAKHQADDATAVCTEFAEEFTRVVAAAANADATADDLRAFSGAQAQFLALATAKEAAIKELGRAKREDKRARRAASEAHEAEVIAEFVADHGVAPAFIEVTSTGIKTTTPDARISKRRRR